jgi:hypothetical protein
MDDHIESLVRAGVTINMAQKAVVDEPRFRRVAT